MEKSSGGKKKCFLLRGWVFYNSPYLSMGGTSCVLWHEAPYLVLVHQLTWDSMWSYCLVDLDWTLAITSLPGGYCSIGTGYPEKFRDLHPWRLLSLGEAEPKLIWPVGDPALSRNWDWMTSRAPFESMFLWFCSFLNKKIQAILYIFTTHSFSKIKIQTFFFFFYRKKVNQNQYIFLFDKVPAFLIVRISFIPLYHGRIIQCYFSEATGRVILIWS